MTGIVDTVAFWGQRHAALDAWRSGGDRGLTPEENYEFYLLRAARLIGFVRAHFGPGRALRGIEGGCGRGHFVHWMRSCGLQMRGYDSSAHAVEQARINYGPHFSQARMHEFAEPAPLDLVLCIDVLFHIIDDGEWEAGLRNLLQHVRTGGLLIVTDRFGTREDTLSDYIRFRSEARYRVVLEPAGFHILQMEPYAMSTNPVSYLVATRPGQP